MPVYEFDGSSVAISREHINDEQSIKEIKGIILRGIAHAFDIDISNAADADVIEEYKELEKKFNQVADADPADLPLDLVRPDAEDVSHSVITWAATGILLRVWSRETYNTYGMHIGNDKREYTPYELSIMGYAMDHGANYSAIQIQPNVEDPELWTEHYSVGYAGTDIGHSGLEHYQPFITILSPEHPVRIKIEANN